MPTTPHMTGHKTERALQENTYRPSTMSRAAPTGSSSPTSSLRTRNTFVRRSSTAFYRYLNSGSEPHQQQLTQHRREDSPDTLHIIVAFLLYDGKQNEKTFETMNEEGVFPRLLELIQERVDDNAGLHRMLLELLYEMSRIQRLRIGDLSKKASDGFVGGYADKWCSINRRQLHHIHVPDH